MDEFLEQVADYANILEGYIYFNELPDEWFVAPDHVAIKSADAEGFKLLVEQLREAAEQISCIDMDGRRLATAKLKEPINVGTLGEVSWVEIMEPRPERVGKDFVGLEHMEFTYPDFDEVARYLDNQGCQYEFQKNPGHSWVNIPINGQDGRYQELKINNRALGAVVQAEIEEGKSYLL